MRATVLLLALACALAPSGRAELVASQRHAPATTRQSSRAGAERSTKEPKRVALEPGASKSRPKTKAGGSTSLKDPPMAVTDTVTKSSDVPCARSAAVPSALQQSALPWAAASLGPSAPHHSLQGAPGQVEVLAVSGAVSRRLFEASENCAEAAEPPRPARREEPVDAAVPCSEPHHAKMHSAQISTAGIDERNHASRQEQRPLEGSQASCKQASPVVITPEMLPNAPADIDLDSELEGADLHQVQTLAASGGMRSPSITEAATEKATAAAERARQAAQRGMLALSVTWSVCIEQARQAASACRLDSVERCVRNLPAMAARLVPPTPARRGLQTLVSESASLWAGALWKILMLQVLVIVKTVVAQGSVIARSFIQAASLEPTALVLDSPMLQRQRSRAKVLAATFKAEEARARLKELQAQMQKTAESLREAELASKAYTSQGKCARWSESDYLQSVASSSSGSLWCAGQHVIFEGSSGSLSPRLSRVAGSGGGQAPQTPGQHGRRSVPSQALLMSASRRTPLPASPLPPPTPAGIR